MLGKTFGDLYLLFKYSQLAVAVEQHTVETVRRKVFSHLYLLPVLCPATVVLKHLYLFAG
jgi:hypothetical protein